MSTRERKRILSSVEAKQFIGRTGELDQLVRHATGTNGMPGITVMGAPGIGLTELLVQTFDQLFYQQDDVIPFYFQIKRSDRSIEQLAVRFIQSFLQQTVAFRRRDSSILKISPDVCEISQLSVPKDGYWIDRLVETCEVRSKLNDKSSFIRQALSAPLRAAARGAKSFVMIDDLQNCEVFSGEIDILEELKEIYSRSNTPFAFAGRRRYVFDAVRAGQKNLDQTQNIEVEELSFSDAGRLSENLAKNGNVKITDQTRDLISQQFFGNPSLIRALFQTANEKGANLDTFYRVQDVYADAILGGKIKGFYDSIFRNITPDPGVEKQLISLLYSDKSSDRAKDSVDSWKNHLDLNSGEFYSLMRSLNVNEVTRQTSNLVEPMNENDILSDYIESRFRLEIRNDGRALVVAESLSEFLKRAPIKMSKFYRRNSALGLREFMAVFDCQEIPLSLLEYDKFKTTHKGKNAEEILDDARTEGEKLRLPQIVYAAHTFSFYTPLSKLTENERSAVAFGFEAADYKDESEIVWIAAEIDSKLEATEDLAGFWCDRLEMVALMCNFAKYRLWLIAPEGFTPEAMKVLRSRNAIGSSRAQVELLSNFLGAEEVLAAQPDSNEYEMVLPMGDDTELIAAYALEEIARKHSFGTKAINQIKTALVEACINATEHSHSPDRKIYQKFSVEEDKIKITVSNRGLRFKGTESKEIQPDQGRRGWGLKLMKSLMDDVTFEQVDDGTRISMTKQLAKT